MIQENSIDLRNPFFDAIYELGEKDKNVVFLTADTDAWGLKRFQDEFPDRFYNLGLAEQNMVTVAAGLALCGKKVFIYAMIPFVSMRCYEQIKVNICHMRLPVTIIGLCTGLDLAMDGPGLHGVMDVGAMRMISELTIFNPSDPITATASAKMAYAQELPAYIRLHKGATPALYDEDTDFSSGFSVIKDGFEFCIVVTGVMVHRVLKIAKELSHHSIRVGVIDVFRLKPINEKDLINVLQRYKKIVTIEENSIIGGLGSLVSEMLSDSQQPFSLKRIAIKDEICLHYGDRAWLHKKYGIDAETIIQKILTW